LARLYKVSADTNEKEKAVGGILTFAQAGWLVLGGVIWGGLFLLLAQILPPIIAVILAIIPGAGVGGAFAFYTKNELPLLTYLIYRRDFNRQTKQLVNDLVYEKIFPEESSH